MFWIVVILLAILLLLYAFYLRPKLKANPKYTAFFAWIEPIERTLWQKSRTILVGWMYTLAGLLVALHDTIAQAIPDWTPIATWVVAKLEKIPADLRSYAVSLGIALASMFTGWVMIKLRSITDKPLDEKAKEG